MAEAENQKTAQKRSPKKKAEPDSAPAAEGHAALARKYRPKTFPELIGQEAMVRTLRNAFGKRRTGAETRGCSTPTQR